MELNLITEKIIGCSFKVHLELGPGLLESAYEACLFYELLQNNLKVQRQQALPLVYHDIKLEAGYRIDLLVEKKIIIEVKAVECFTDVHIAQVLTYLKLSKCKIGLLLNFNVTSLKKRYQKINCLNVIFF